MIKKFNSFINENIDNKIYYLIEYCNYFETYDNFGQIRDIIIHQAKRNITTELSPHFNNVFETEAYGCKDMTNELKNINKIEVDEDTSVLRFHHGHEDWQFFIFDDKEKAKEAFKILCDELIEKEKQLLRNTKEQISYFITKKDELDLL